MMISFFLSILLLILGYFLYGKLVEQIFAPNDKPTPALTLTDGTDYMPMKTSKIFLIQLLNIAGIGPIFGAILGALWGPVVFLWIALGSILAGGVHDYLSGMISLRHQGNSISETVGIYLGKTMKQVMRVFSVILMVLVGTVFMTSPASLLANLTPNSLGMSFWVVMIFVYYILATILPINKLIGRIYPFFGFILLIMAFGIAGSLVLSGHHIPDLQLQNLHPDALPIWSMMFITVACGAVSGFHATQSPMMARCLKIEKDGRKVFYGAMIAEGFIALIWAAAGVAFYETTGGLAQALTNLGGQAGVVYDISFSLLGTVGGLLAIIGVVICPITSGDTAFRSARLILADWFQVNQSTITKRLLISIPLLLAGVILTQINFDIIWRYFSWSNQTLAMIVLWTGAVYVYRHNTKKASCFIAAIPAAFMSAVSCTYILQAAEGFHLATTIAYPGGIIFAILCFFVFLKTTFFKKTKIKK